MLRTFLALDLEEPFLRATVALMDELRAERLPRPRWVSTHALHVTLRFLGETQEELVPAIRDVVLALGKTVTQPIEVRATSLLAFPDPRRARVLALHLEDSGGIAKLAAECERAVTALGFAPEQRRFRPHLTLARFREPADLRRLLATRSTPRSGGQLVAFTFYESQLGGKEGPLHRPLVRVELGAST